MPFTFSHPAIVLPLLKGKHKLFSATGLIAGSMAPDFESFIRLNKPKIYSHTWLGIFWFDLPLTIIIAMVFHWLIRDPLIANLPLALRRRFERFKGINWFAWFKKHFWVVICSMLIGITSHLLWDALTHLNLYSPDDSPANISPNSLYWSSILQYSNSLLGLGVIFWVIYRMPQTAVAPDRYTQWHYWPAIIIISILAAMMETWVTGVLPSFIISIEVGISSFFIALILVSLIYKYAIK